MDAKLPPLAAFILPGGGRCSAYLHVCRSVCRRAERAAIAVREKEVSANTKLFIDTQRFMNRLSDYFFVLARFVSTEEEKIRTR
jgi:cob(I)alamin adenosyltransferase